MSFSYLGITWSPRSASEHANDLLANINAVLSANNVQVNGVLVQFKASITNIVWIICLAVGALRAVYDQILFAASLMFSVEQCSDSQLLAALPLSGTKLIPQAFTQATILVTAAGSGDAVIPTNAVLPFGTICNFLVQTGATVPAGTSASFLCTSDTAGPIAVGAGTLVAFNPSIANVQSITNPLAGVAGCYQETPQQVRQRLLQGNIADIGINGTERAVKSVQGILSAALYFNFDTVNNLLIPGGIVVPPRYAYLAVRGSDITGVNIASAYARRMTAPTLGAQSQNFVTLSGQTVPVKFDYAAGYAVYVIVYYDANSVTQAGFDDSIKEVVSAIAPDVGQEVTVAMILQALAGFSFALITGASISGDGINWGNKVSVPANKYGTLAVGNITVVAG